MQNPSPIQNNPSAADQLLPLVYNDLRRLARAKLAGEPPGQTLEATALVHEAYLRLVSGDNQNQWNSRGHFYAAAAEAMRRILIERARRKLSEKHGGHFARIDLDAADVGNEVRPEQLLALDAALADFQEQDPEKATLVKLRFFAGMTIEEAAALLDISVTTAKRHWTYARAWLERQMRQG
jgi:RNA polymerase sigma factor (TIGR02999 family)